MIATSNLVDRGNYNCHPLLADEKSVEQARARAHLAGKRNSTAAATASQETIIEENDLSREPRGEHTRPSCMHLARARARTHGTRDQFATRVAAFYVRLRAFTLPRLSAANRASRLNNEEQRLRKLTHLASLKSASVDLRLIGDKKTLSLSLSLSSNLFHRQERPCAIKSETRDTLAPPY